jgi:parvulin-like peptidyl-prolyl isomerase
MPETLPQPFVAAEPSSGPRSRPRRRALRRPVAVLGLLALVLAACGSDSPAGLTVGSTTIDESTVNQELAAITKNSVLKAQAVKDGKLDPAAAATWLTSVVETQVAAEAVEEAGTKITKADRDQAKSWADSFFGDPSAFQAFPKSFREDALERYANVPAYVRTHTKPPTEAEVRAAYDESLVRNCPSQRYVSHILTTSEEAAKTAESELAAGGTFREVAIKNSTDAQSAQRGGALGCIDAQQLDATFAAGANATPVGSVSAPIKTQYGWHIIKVEDVKQALPYDTVKSEIRTDMIEQGPEGRKKLEKLMAKTKVTVASKYGRWVVKDGIGTVVPPKVTTSSTSSTTKPSGSSTTTTTKG